MYYVIYTHTKNSYPVAEGIVTLVDKNKVHSIEEAKQLSHALVQKIEGYANDSCYICETSEFNEKIMKTEDDVVYYPHHRSALQFG